ncbi:MAG: hypothetical protein CFK52_02975 [Chloracidobacterium sp. CP2_5A]|nr:MAG: hypothetical protein CFK52_02975 [Chloracidobacterium sp. CP2_5A]
MSLSSPPSDESVSSLPDNPPLARHAVGWTVSAAVATWLLSVGSIFLASIGAQLGWMAWFYWRQAAMPTEADMLESRSLTLALALSTFVAHAVTLLWCWKLIERTSPLGPRAALGLDWWRQSLWSRSGAILGASLLAAPAFLAIGAWLEQYLPNAKTDLDRILALGPSIRVAIALVAALSAPLVEEIVYRGILFGALQRRFGAVAAVALVSVLFLVVHIPQYWGGWAGLTMLGLLSLALTLLRALTGSVAPSMALHYAFNGIQAIAIIFFWELLEAS